MCSLKCELLTSVCSTGGWCKISSNVYKQRMNLRCRVILPLHRHTQLNQMLVIKWSPPSLRANVVGYGVIFCKAQTDLNKTQYEEQLISHQNSRNYVCGGGKPDSVNIFPPRHHLSSSSSSFQLFLVLFFFLWCSCLNFLMIYISGMQQRVQSITNIVSNKTVFQK